VKGAKATQGYKKRPGPPHLGRHLQRKHLAGLDLSQMPECVTALSKDHIAGLRGIPKMHRCRYSVAKMAFGIQTLRKSVRGRPSVPRTNCRRNRGRCQQNQPNEQGRPRGSH
jgi:hypothetical protein